MEKIYLLKKIPKSNKNTLALMEKFKQEHDLIAISIGKILGDCSINKSGNLIFCHSIKQKEYIEHCYNLFKEFTKSGIKLRHRVRKGVNNQELCFDTCALYKEYIDLFYINEPITNKRIKIIPPNLGELLTKKSLAYWIMDDGTRTHNSLMLCTHSFSLEENQLLVQILAEKFKLDCKIMTCKNQNTLGAFWHPIQINNVAFLWNLVKEDIIPSMRYKFGKFCDLPLPLPYTKPSMYPAITCESDAEFTDEEI